MAEAVVTPDPECVFDGPSCGLRDHGYTCTRPIGHAGEHRAHGEQFQVLHTWRWRQAEIAAVLLTSLKRAAPSFCSLRCPSTFTSLEQPRHLPECDAMRAAIERAEGR